MRKKSICAKLLIAMYSIHACMSFLFKKCTCPALDVQEIKMSIFFCRTDIFLVIHSILRLKDKICSKLNYSPLPKHLDQTKKKKRYFDQMLTLNAIKLIIWRCYQFLVFWIENVHLHYVSISLAVSLGHVRNMVYTDC